jgi:hypothetical protein
MPRARLIASTVALLLSAAAATARPTETAFTYQGRLTDGGSPASGSYDFMFRLYNSASASIVLAGPVTVEDVPVANGLFTAKIDLGDVFDGGDRWLQISVRPGASTGSFTVLSPRQQLTPCPNAIVAQSLALPYLGADSTDAGLISSGLIHLLQNGTDNALYAQTNSTGAAVRAHATANGTGVRGTSDNFRAGWFEIDNAASPHIALYGTTNGTGVAVEGYTTGTGKAVARYNSGAQGNAGYFRNQNAANTHEALFAETVGNGAAIVAKASGLGPALQIADGYIKVDGAGVGTATPVFIHQVTSGNRGDIDGDGVYDYTTIDHPLCNGNPSSILIVTPAVNADGVTMSPAVTVYYESGRWRLWNARSDSDWSIDISDRYNILVFRP